MSSGAPSPPKPSAAEQRAFTSQADLLDLFRQQLQEQGVESRYLQPLLYDELGLTPTYADVPAQVSGSELKAALGKKSGKGINDTSMYSLADALALAGNKQNVVQGLFANRQGTKQLTGLTKNPETQAELNRKEIERLGTERELAALRGELPLNPGLLSDLDKQERQMRLALTKQLGPGWETSTPGIEATRQFNLMKNTVLENARRGDLTLADALQTGALGNTLTSRGAFMTGSGAATQLPFGNIGGYGQVAQGYGNLGQALSAQRMAQYQAQLASGQGSGFGQIFGSLTNLGGTLGAAYLLA